jgi:mRNA interferase RelE/StbE
MAYRVEFATSAVREFKGLERPMQRRIAVRIDQLATNPLPADVKKLTGKPDHYRIRIGEYRVIYTIEKKRVVVLVLKIAHRRDVYR